MAVHEIRYRAYDGPVSLSIGRLWAIPKFSLQAVWGRALNIMMFGTGSLQLIAYMGYLFIFNNELIVTALKLGKVPTVSSERLLYQFLGGQIFLAFIVMATAGPRMISPELQHRALALIYARPISRPAYILGKFLGLAGLVFYLTGLQAAFMFLGMYAFYPDTHEFHQHFLSNSLPLLFRALLVGGMTSLLYPLVALAASAASTNRKFATMVFLGIAIGSSVVSGILWDNVSHKFGVVGLFVILSEWNRELFHINPGEAVLSLTQTAFGAAMWVGAALLFLRWRLKPVEVYAE